VRVNFVRKNVLKNHNDMQTKMGEARIADSSQLDLFRGMKVLDVGCGAGILAEGLGRLGMGSVTGIDPTPKCIELAQAHLDLDKDGLADRVDYKNVTIEHVI